MFGLITSARTLSESVLARSRAALRRDEFNFLESKEVSNSLFGSPLSPLQYIWARQINVTADEDASAFSPPCGLWVCSFRMPEQIQADSDAEIARILVGRMCSSALWICDSATLMQHEMVWKVGSIERGELELRPIVAAISPGAIEENEANFHEAISGAFVVAKALCICKAPAVCRCHGRHARCARCRGAHAAFMMMLARVPDHTWSVRMQGKRVGCQGLHYFLQRSKRSPVRVREVVMVGVCARTPRMLIHGQGCPKVFCSS